MLSPVSLFLSPKTVLREKLKAERRRAREMRPDAPRHAARLFLDHAPLAAGAVVALYHPLNDELDTGPLAEALHEKGVALALPAVARKNAPLVFRRWRPGDTLFPGRHRTQQPGDDAEAVVPDIVVTPLVGFARDGARLGLGGGYYDRTLEALRAEGPVIAIGYAYGAQEIDALPASTFDQPLDWIVTEREAIAVNRGGTA